MAEMEVQTSVWLFSGVAPGSEGEGRVKKQITSGERMGWRRSTMLTVGGERVVCKKPPSLPEHKQMQGSGTWQRDF